MTYNATCDILQSASEAGRIIPFCPALRKGEGLNRYIYLSSDLHQAVSPTETLKKNRKLQLSALQASLKRFVTGGAINNKSYMKRMVVNDTSYVWEIRTTSSIPQLRVFGNFLAPDIFVCTHFCDRDLLGNRSASIWDREKKKTLKVWDVVLDHAPVFHADHFDSYITINGFHHDWED